LKISQANDYTNENFKRMKKVIQTFTLFLLAVFAISCKDKPLSNVLAPQILNSFKQKGVASGLPDFSFAGYKQGAEIPHVKDGKVFYVTDYGAIANDGKDDTKAIQLTVDEAGKKGGGIVLFSPGTFHVNMDTTSLNIIRIDYSNLVLRGSGSGKDGTIIYAGSATNQPEDQSPWLSPFAFHTGLNLHDTYSFYSVDEEQVLAKFLNDVPAGDDIIELSSTEGLNAGDVIIVAMRNTTDEGDLMNELMAPLKFEPFQKTYLEAGVRRDPSFQWAVEVKEIIDGHQVKLCQPLHRDVQVKYKAFVAKTEMLRNIGIEHFRFESAWDGKYKHHGNREMDYGWGAVCLHRVIHGWIHDLEIDNYTQATHLVNSRNISISNVRIIGGEGHYGPKMYSSSDNLVENIQVDAKRTHGPGLEGCCFGNVYRNIVHKYPAPLDLHGISGEGFCPPMYNLYENITGVYRIAGGGAPQNLPHAGEGNTFWNIEMTGWEEGDYNEMFYSWIWRDPGRFKNEMHIDCHKQYLRSIVVGVRHPKPTKKLTIEHFAGDRSDQWIYVEGLNKTVGDLSLYDEQCKLRKKSDHN
jgi:hypothetical protein